MRTSTHFFTATLLQPDFSTTPIDSNEKVDEWLRFYEMSAPLVSVGCLVSTDPVCVCVCVCVCVRVCVCVCVLSACDELRPCGACLNETTLLTKCETIAQPACQFFCHKLRPSTVLTFCPWTQLPRPQSLCCFLVPVQSPAPGCLHSSFFDHQLFRSLLWSSALLAYSPPPSYHCVLGCFRPPTAFLGCSHVLSSSLCRTWTYASSISTASARTAMAATTTTIRRPTTCRTADTSTSPSSCSVSTAPKRRTASGGT